MKKFLAILLFTALILTLCSFTSNSKEESNEKEEQSAFQEKNDVEHEPFIVPGSWDISGIIIDSWEEYQEYISASENLHSDFIAYQDISDFGNFFRYGTDVLKDDGSLDWWSHSQYWYNLQEGEDVFILLVSHEEQPIEAVNMLSSTAHADMRVFPSHADEENESFTYHGITYEYYMGKLDRISWYSGNVYFQLLKTSNLGFFDYTGDNVAINALLNKDTAGSVKLAFDNMMAKKAEAAK